MRRVLLLTVFAAAGCRFLVPSIDDLTGGPDLSVGDLPPAPVDLVAVDLTPPPQPDLAVAPPKSCYEILQKTPGLPSGIYAIDPGLPPGTPPQSVYCDMTNAGGGWTLVQRTLYDFNQSMALLTNYAGFYSQTLGQPDAGHAFRLAGRYWPALNTQQQHLLIHLPRAIDGSNCKALFYVGGGAAWTVTPPDGGASIGALALPPVPFFDGTMLSTTDEGPSQNCVLTYDSVPWPYGACCSTCPTYGSGGVAHPGANYLATPDLYGHAIADRCAPLAPSFNIIYVDNGMEYYIR